MNEPVYTFEPVGFVRSELTQLEAAPLQGTEGAPAAWIEIGYVFTEAMMGITVGDELVILTWLHRAQREVLQVHPRGNPENPLTGVFATRSQDRPNPIGLHPVSVLEIKGNRLRVAPLEAVDGTPVIDLKPVLR